MALSFTALTTLSTPPSKADPENFTTRADTFLGGLPDFQTEMNTTITELNKITSGLDAASVIAAWAVGTTYDFPDLVAGSDGYTYRCVDTAVIGENPTTDNGTHWIRVSEAPLGNPSSNGMVLASTTAGVRSWQYAGLGVTPTGVTLTGNISGLNLSKTGANQVTVSVGFALDSTGSIPLSLATATAVTIPAAANTNYHIFVVRLVSDSSITAQAYTTEAGVEADATVNMWRWVGFCRTNGSNAVFGFSMAGDEIQFGNDFVIGAATASTASVDLNTFVPKSRISGFRFGALTAFAELSVDGGTVFTAFADQMNGNGTDTSLGELLIVPSSLHYVRGGSTSGTLIFRGVKLIR